jgi:hypothetical protein
MGDLTSCDRCGITCWYNHEGPDLCWKCKHAADRRLDEWSRMTSKQKLADMEKEDRRRKSNCPKSSDTLRTRK